MDSFKWPEEAICKIGIIAGHDDASTSHKSMKHNICFTFFCTL